MKKLFLTAAMVTLCFFSFSQSNKEEIDMEQAAFGKDKKEIVAQFIQLEGAEKDNFWKIYDEYETKRKALGRQRMDLLNKYVDTYQKLNDESGDKIIKEIMAMQKQTDQLINTYYNKIKKASGGKSAAQFYQLENYVLAMIRSTIMEQIPLIGQ